MNRNERRRTQHEQVRTIPLSKEDRDVLERQFARFEAKFGRKPAGDDPIFFDPDQDTPQPLDEEHMRNVLLEAMSKAHIAPELIYAFNKTGRMVSETNQKYLTEEELEEWNSAVQEYFELSQRQQ